MKRILLFILFTGTFSINCFAIDYPAWFLYPKLYPSIIAGFSYKGNPPLMDAEVMYCVYKHCEVSGYIETVSNKKLNFLTNTQYHYIYPSESMKWVSGKLFKQDRFVLSVMTEDYVDAFSLTQDLVMIKKYYNQDSVPKPKWLAKNVWSDGEFYYGVGVTTSLGNPSECWKNSEEQAVFAILTSISMQFYSINILSSDSKLDRDEFTEYTRTDLKFELSSIQTLERYPDPENNLFYTLVKIPRRSVIPLSFDKGSK